MYHLHLKEGLIIHRINQHKPSSSEKPVQVKTLLAMHQKCSYSKDNTFFLCPLSFHILLHDIAFSKKHMRAFLLLCTQCVVASQLKR